MPLETSVASSLGTVVNRLLVHSHLRQSLVGERPLGHVLPPVPWPGRAEGFDRIWQCCGFLQSVKDRGEPARRAGFESGKQAFELFVLL
jgi:hypothetical protein